MNRKAARAGYIVNFRVSVISWTIYVESRFLFRRWGMGLNFFERWCHRYFYIV